MNGLAQNVAGHAGVEARVLGVHTLDLVTVRVARVRAFPQQNNSFWNSNQSGISKFQIPIALTIITLFVPLNIGDHAGHVHRAVELGRLAHLQCHVLRGLKYIW